MVKRSHGKNIKTNNGSNGSDKGICNRFDPLNDNDKDNEDNEGNREGKKKDQRKLVKILESK